MRKFFGLAALCLLGWTLLGGNVQQVVNSIVATTCTAQFARAISATGAATCATVSLTADVTGVLPLANGGTASSTFPNFKVSLTGGNQTPTSGTITKVNFDTTVIDVGTYWDGTNHNYKPLVSGTYQFCANVTMGGTFTLGQDLALYISKNGIANGAGTSVIQSVGLVPTIAGNNQTQSACVITSMNGSTDTVEADVAVTATSPLIIGTGTLVPTAFFGYRVGP